MSPTIMIATLGGQPQVITFTLDALLARGETITDVYIIHPSLRSPRLQQAATRLLQEFRGDCYGTQPCRLHRVPLTLHDEPLDDIRTETEADVTWQAVRSLIADLKHQGHALHLCLSGGRRMIALLATSAAALLCDHRDRVWHLYTPDALQQRAKGGAVMHAAPEDGVQLMPVPLVPWGTYFPALRAMAQAPQEAVAAQMGWLEEDETRCQQVYHALTERQRDTLRAFARGLAPQDVAESLGVTMSTVNAHKTVILDECRNAWQFAEDQRLDYHFLRKQFDRFVSRLGVG